jgi:hypothetical protein
MWASTAAIAAAASSRPSATTVASRPTMTPRALGGRSPHQRARQAKPWWFHHNPTEATMRPVSSRPHHQSSSPSLPWLHRIPTSYEHTFVAGQCHVLMAV